MNDFDAICLGLASGIVGLGSMAMALLGQPQFVIYWLGSGVAIEMALVSLVILFDW